MKKSSWKDPYAAREATNYKKPVPSREFLCNYLEQFTHPVSCHHLAKKLGISDADELDGLKRRLLAMTRDAQITLMSNRRFISNKKCKLVKGIVEAHRDGFGHFIPDNGKEILYLSPYQMQRVFHHDKINVKILGNRRYKGRKEAVVVNIIHRAHKTIIGIFHNKDDASFVEPTNRRINQDIIIPTNATMQAQPGQLVEAIITEYPTIHTPTIGKISKILGNYDNPGIETKVTQLAYDIPHQWPSNIQKELDNLSLNGRQDSHENRIDLRHFPFVTIDGDDAKDFDDAVYCEPHNQGWRLFVAIADVSHYVKPNSALDKEALRRGTSVYFPNEVTPMLPEMLSNDLCSLKPFVDRLALVCEMLISQKGNLSRHCFYPATINSNARLTYEQMGAFLDNQPHHIDNTLLPHLTHLNQLYHVLYQQRLNNGMIEFEIDEIKAVFNANQKIDKLISVTRNNAHKLIEECMLRANIAAARFIKKHKIPALYRVHNGPKPERIDDLRQFLGKLGLQFGGGKKPSPTHYADILAQAKGRPDERLIHIMLLRSMSRAIYSPEKKEHFSLVFKEYTHFTSPIRRYPDLIIHRLIKSVTDEQNHYSLNKKELQSIGQHCSETEQQADQATRDTLKWLKCEYMREKINKQFNGVISSVTSFGFFVELTDIFVEGLVHINSLDDGRYNFDFATQQLRSYRTGRCFHIGDTVTVKVVQVDMVERQIDLVLTNKNPY